MKNNSTLLNRYEIPEKNSALEEKYILVLKEIGCGKKVLELGCHNGSFSKKIVENNNYLIGVDIDKLAIQKASEICDEVYLIDLNNPRVLYDHLTTKSFDYILAMDVLEHLTDPATLLKLLSDLIKDTGEILITLPNIAYWFIRKELLFGEFNYKEVGILDRTHMRFFTFYTAQCFIKECGLNIEEWLPLAYQMPLVGRLGLRNFSMTASLISKIERAAATKIPNFFCAQFYFKTCCNKKYS